jgi:antitoxin Phd
MLEWRAVATMYIQMYTFEMSKQSSIADARRNLPTLVDEAEAGSEVQLTRRGRAVAVLVSIEEYERLKSHRMTFAEAYEAFRRKFPVAREGISSRYFRSVRERGRGREVDL